MGTGSLLYTNCNRNADERANSCLHTRPTSLPLARRLATWRAGVQWDLNLGVWPSAEVGTMPNMQVTEGPAQLSMFDYGMPL